MAAPRVALREITKDYPTGRGVLHVLAGVTLHAAAGEFVSVIGPSGCGKSTMFAVAAGLERPTSGAVLVDGTATTGQSERFAFMPQKDLLLPWRRIIDNAALGLEVEGMRRREARARVADLFEPFGLAGFERAYPHELSGGMRQRVALLRTVALGRSVILLDEPFGALDAMTRADMRVWLESVWERDTPTVLLITHDIREAVYLSDRVYVLSPRPARVRDVVPIGLPRPREPSMLTSRSFLTAETRIQDALRGSPH